MPDTTLSNPAPNAIRNAIAARTRITQVSDMMAGIDRWSSEVTAAIAQY